ncbi:hypothetical protein [Chromobacterium sp. LK1]|uniref:hypothetical protein n=1 Tax=Chromobacterium sp. LK1 TaxID=1628193 RepID=UPI0012E117AC|nr:hypothetical protein [Chromobacterium sp. LK1]
MLYFPTIHCRQALAHLAMPWMINGMEMMRWAGERRLHDIGILAGRGGAGKVARIAALLCNKTRSQAR